MGSEKQMTMRMMLLVVLAAFLASESAVVMVCGRYLPTRSQDDKIERLRELLKDLLENNRQQELNYDQGEALSGHPQMVGLGPVGGGVGIGSSGRSILFKRDIQQGHSGSSHFRLNPSIGRPEGQVPLEGSPLRLPFSRK